MTADGDQGPPTRGTIRSISGRETLGGRKGLPKVSEVVIEHRDGEVVSASVDVPPRGATRVQLRVVATAHPRTPEICTICIERPAKSKEHIPPKQFGGKVMTYTCTQCNNAFGGKVEANLLKWYDNEFQIVFKHPEEGKPLGRGTAQGLITAGGELLFLLRDGNFGGLREMIRDGQIIMEMSTPRQDVVPLAILKSAYLAAQLFIGGVPDVPSANEIRAELQSVVNAPSRRSIVVGPRARALRFGRTGLPAHTDAVTLLQSDDPESEILLCLGGTLWVEWPFPEIPPNALLGGALYRLDEDGQTTRIGPFVDTGEAGTMASET